MKKEKKILLIVLITIAVILGVVLICLFIFKDDEEKKVSVVDEISSYGYVLEDNETKLYNDLFEELKSVLNKEELDEGEYALIISKLFVADFYTLNNKLTKTDIGGVQFIYDGARENFSLKASDTFYKYLENNLDGKREVVYPEVLSFKEESVSEITYTLEETEYPAYQVLLSWEYDMETTYQNKAYLTLIKKDDKLSIVEVSKIEE